MMIHFICMPDVPSTYRNTLVIPHAYIFFIIFLPYLERTYIKHIYDVRCFKISLFCMILICTDVAGSVSLRTVNTGSAQSYVWGTCFHSREA